jgi:hypothetical protein
MADSKELNKIKTLDEQAEIKVGEDISFCNQLRKKGIPIHVDLEAHVGHRKSLALSWDDDMRDPLLDSSEWRTPDAGKRIYSS